MATKLEKVLKREITINGKAYMVAISPEGLKVTQKGFRRGQELTWRSIVSGEAENGTAAQGFRQRDRRRLGRVTLLRCTRRVGEVFLNDHPPAAAIGEDSGPRASDHMGAPLWRSVRNPVCARHHRRIG